MLAMKLEPKSVQSNAEGSIGQLRAAMESQKPSHPRDTTLKPEPLFETELECCNTRAELQQRCKLQDGWGDF